MERPTVNAFMVVPKLPDRPPTTTNPGSGSGSKPGPAATTTTTAPVKLTVAGRGSAPAIGGVANPTATVSSSVLSSSVGDILRNPNTKRPRRQTGKAGKTKKNKDGQEEIGADPSIPDWNDITAALTPEAVAGGDQPAELSLGSGPSGHARPGHGLGPMLLDLVAAGMILSVLCGLQRARHDRRPRPALWL
jgi:hypothetical protein